MQAAGAASWTAFLVIHRGVSSYVVAGTADRSLGPDGIVNLILGIESETSAEQPPWIRSESNLTTGSCPSRIGASTR
jgi:hypothetical protein